MADLDNSLHDNKQIDQDPVRPSTPSSPSEPRSPGPSSVASSISSKEVDTGVYANFNAEQQESPAGVADFRNGKFKMNASDPRPEIDEELKSTESVPKNKNIFDNWINAYRSFMLKNVNRIVWPESTLQQAMYLFPGKFKDVEVASEGSKLPFFSPFHVNFDNCLTFF